MKSDSKTPLIEKKVDKGPPWWKSKRYFITFLTAIGCGNFYFQRVNLSMAIVCMVNHTTVDIDRLGDDWRPHGPVDTTDCLAREIHDRENGHFNWNKTIQGLVLAGLYIGFFVIMIPALRIVKLIGGKSASMNPTIGISLLTLLSPMSAQISSFILLYVRVVMGLMCAIGIPGLYMAIDAWAPIGERTLIMGLVFTGSILANAAVYPVSAFFCLYGYDEGWPAVFYAFGITGLVWCLIWYVHMYDSPEEDPYIDPREQKYLMEHRYVPIKSKEPTPWKILCKSIRIWAIIWAQIAFTWQFFTWLAVMPMYNREVLNLDIEANGFHCMLPYVFMAIFFNLWAWLCRWLKREKKVRVLIIERVSVVLGFTLASIFYIMLCFMDCRDSLAVLMLAIGLGFSAVALRGFCLNPFIVCPSYAFQVMSLSHCLSLAIGIFSAPFATVITTRKLHREWQIVILVCCVLMLLGALLFLLFSSDRDIFEEEEEETEPAEEVEVEEVPEEPEEPEKTEEKEEEEVEEEKEEEEEVKEEPPQEVRREVSDIWKDHIL